MNMTITDLIPLSPLLVVTATVVLAMLGIAWRRSYSLTATITISGFLVATIVAALLLPETRQQVTPLMIVDSLSLLFTLTSCVAALFIAILAYPYLQELDDQREEYFLLLALATVGAVVMVSSNHFVTTVLGLETLSMSLYGMIAYPLHSQVAGKYPLEASVKYLVLSAAASAFILFGVALIYAATGTLTFASLQQGPDGVIAPLDPMFAVVALTMVAVGIGFKLSLAPFHLWTPDVYEGAPLPSTAYLATIGKAAMFVVLLRYVEASDALAYPAVLSLFTFIAILSMLAGNLLALMQDNLKRILAYSSIAHMGYLLVALIAGYYASGTLSVEAVLFYLLAYVVMTLGAFGVASVVSSSAKEFDVIHDYRGLFWREPWLAAIMTGMLLSLAGIPLTVGFIGKFYVFFAGVESGLWLLLAAMVIGSGIGLYYYLRIVYRMLMPEKDRDPFREGGVESLSSYGVLVLLFVMLILFGVYPTPLVTLIESTSAGL